MVGRIELPPLRERSGDIALLARVFAKAAGYPENAVPHDALVRWEDSPWPGNVRELRNAVAQLLELGTFSSPRGAAADGASPHASALLAMAEEHVMSGVPLPIAGNAWWASSSVTTSSDCSPSTAATSPRRCARAASRDASSSA